VSIFKPELQGIADSLSYLTADSLIYLYNDPVLWSDNSQMKADTISILMSNGRIDRMFLDTKAFVTSLTLEEYYNQVKGRHMIAFFKESKLSQVDVNGNGESIYFELEEEDSLVMGMNKVICSNMRLKFSDQKIKDITFYSPDGSFIPFHEINPENTRLSGFTWRENEKPTRAGVLGTEPRVRPVYQEPVEQPVKVKPVEAGIGTPSAEDLQKLRTN
jgi:lipopolysaccharide export system protein LptA